MERTINMTADEMRQAFSEALGFDGLAEDGDDIKTLEQLAAMFGCSRNAAEGRAKRAESRGTMERVRVRRISANGRVWILVAYRLVQK